MPEQKKVRIVKRRKKKRFKKRALLILTILTVLFLAVLTYGAYLYIKASSAFSGAYEDDGSEKSDLRNAIVDPKTDNISILIMGVDENEHDEEMAGQPVRTDALMVTTLNREDKSIKMLSIPRDSYVYVPIIDDYTKINHAFAYGEANDSGQGGTKATIHTVEHLLDIPIDYYVKVNFEAFVDVVDALDGVTVDVPYEFYEQDSHNNMDAIHLTAGEQELNGEEALALARTRKLDNDIERGKRQQEILKAIIRKSASLGAILKYDQVISAVGSNMGTNMKFSEMKSLFTYITAGPDLDIEALTLEGQDYQPGSVYYWKLYEESLDIATTTLKEHLNIN